MAADEGRHWEHFYHEADIGIRGFGNTLSEAFAAAGEALTAVVTDLESVSSVETVTVEACDEDLEILFVRFLNAVIFEMATRRMLFRAYDVTVNGSRLVATLRGEAVNSAQHQPAVEIKGATLTELQVSPCSEGWYAQCVVDV